MRWHSCRLHTSSATFILINEPEACARAAFQSSTKIRFNLSFARAYNTSIQGIPFPGEQEKPQKRKKDRPEIIWWTPAACTRAYVVRIYIRAHARFTVSYIYTRVRLGREKVMTVKIIVIKLAHPTDKSTTNLNFHCKRRSEDEKPAEPKSQFPFPSVIICFHSSNRETTDTRCSETFRKESQHIREPTFI